MLSLTTASILSGLTPLLAAFIALFCLKQLSLSSRLSSLLLGVSTGLMFAIATLELIPEAISLSEATSQPKTHHHSHHTQAVISELQPINHHADDHHHSDSHSLVQHNLTGCGIAFLLLLILQQLLSASGHSHSHGASNKKNEGATESGSIEEPRPASLRIMTILALAVHSLIDGLVIAGAYKASEGVGARVALAIILHKIPDGVLLTTLILVSKVGNQKDSLESIEIWDKGTILTVLALSVMSPLGSFLTQHFLTTSDFNGFVLSFGAGTFLFITTIEIIPELFKDKARVLPFLALCGGYLSFFAFEYFVHASEAFVE